jgi:hypothetical protein
MTLSASSLPRPSSKSRKLTASLRSNCIPVSRECSQHVMPHKTHDAQTRTPATRQRTQSSNKYVHCLRDSRLHRGDITVVALRGLHHNRSARHIRYLATTSCAQPTINMARRVRCRAAGSVRDTRHNPHARRTDAATEDPSEFFTMIFGGEAFVDWCGNPETTAKKQRNEC